MLLWLLLLLLLQKKIKKLPHKEQLGQQQGPSGALTEEETEFVQALSDTLNQLNDIYIEKEETSVIRVERLESELSTATTAEQLNELHKQFVDFHGEVLLLVHWSILAYTATVKILKKHHKRTGLLVKAPQLGNLLSQPFCSTEVSVSASCHMVSAKDARCCMICIPPWRERDCH
jgi:SPX domain protein involved in polyphosphate accumulation